jgi:hypothetical protein
VGKDIHEGLIVGIIRRERRDHPAIAGPMPRCWNFDKLEGALSPVIEMGFYDNGHGTLQA